MKVLAYFLLSISLIVLFIPVVLSGTDPPAPATGQTILNPLYIRIQSLSPFHSLSNNTFFQQFNVTFNIWNPNSFPVTYNHSNICGFTAYLQPQNLANPSSPSISSSDYVPLCHPETILTTYQPGNTTQFLAEQVNSSGLSSSSMLPDGVYQFLYYYDYLNPTIPLGYYTGHLNVSRNDGYLFVPQQYPTMWGQVFNISISDQLNPAPNGYFSVIQEEPPTVPIDFTFLIITFFILVIIMAIIVGGVLMLRRNSTKIVSSKATEYTVDLSNPVKKDSSSAFCPTCGASRMPEDQYCLNCGTKFKT